MALLAMGLASLIIWAATPSKTYESVASQTAMAEKTCGKDHFTLYNKPVAIDNDGNSAYFLCK